MQSRWLVAAILFSGCGSETNLSKESDPEDLPAPVMRVEPTTLDYGQLMLGDSLLGTFVVGNDGDGDLDVTSVEIAGAAYTLMAPTFPLVLVPGDEVEVDILFAPEGGDTSGLAVVSGSDPLLPTQEVRLLGELGVPRLEIEPVIVDFGAVPVFCEEQTTALLVSAGTMPVTVERLALSGEGYTLIDSPGLPLELAPGETAPVGIAFVPEADALHEGSLVAGSNDPAGDTLAALSGVGLEDGECAPPGSTELVFDVRYERADIAILLDTSSSMGPTTAALASQFAAISSALASSIPDMTWGVGTFDDYNNVGFSRDRPFRLELQQTDDLAMAASVLGSISLATGGTDWEEAGTEALLQAAAGLGYDQNCNRAFNADTDVQPFMAQPGDAFFGTAAGSFDPTVPGTGSNGGMGFRERVFPIFILATDAAMKEPGPDVNTPGGCPGDAALYDAIIAINELGGSFIGVEVTGGWGATPGDQMEAVAIATGSFGDLNGDGLTEPTVTQWSGSEVEFRDAVVRAVEALAGAAIFDQVALEIALDPDGVVLGITPEAYYDVSADTEVVFTLDLDGELLLVPDSAASEARLDLVADDTLVLSQRTIWVR